MIAKADPPPEDSLELGLDGPNPSIVAPAPGPAEANIWPWVVLGGSAVAAGVGAIFGLTASSARSDAEAVSHDPAEIDDLNNKVFANGLTANVLFGVAVAGAATGVTWLFLD